MDSNNSGAAGLLGIIGLVVLYFVLRHFFPSLAAVLLIVFGIIIALIVLLVVIVIILAFNQPKDGSKNGNKVSIDNESAQLLSKARAELMEIRRFTVRIKNKQISETGNVISGLIEKILTVLKDKPDQIPNVRQFLRYYVPTLRSILEKYVRVESSGINVAETTANTVKYLADIRSAMEKQYENLFDDDILDLSVEMEALKLACERDGLLSEDDFKLQNGEDNNMLTL